MAKGKRGGNKRSPLSQELRQALGRKGTPMSSLESARGTNPNKYRMNCQRCVYAFEFRRRGYDVEALPRPDSGYDPMMDGMGWYRAFEGQTWETKLGNRNTAVEKNIKKLMNEWGDGSRAVIYVKWKGFRSAHVFNIENKNGEVYAYDGQSGGMVDLTNYLSLSQPTRTMISRVDNLSRPLDALSSAVKKRGQ